jgi:hypothetical protein
VGGWDGGEMIKEDGCERSGYEERILMMGIEYSDLK